MKMNDSLIAEFEHEARTTRRHLERLPNDKPDWRPHEKSFTAGALASHIIVQFITSQARLLAPRNPLRYAAPLNLDNNQSIEKP